MAEAPLLACLLPARNAERWLPGWFASVEQFADFVVALDDGSTDGTAAVLERHPLVRKLIRQPVRPGYADWDDARNRNLLLDAVAPFQPQWIISLDADERIDAVDAQRLRGFLATDALPGCAYGFYHIPMRGDREHYLPRPQRVFRLFSFTPGQHFPNQRLHFTPIPTAIPDTVRIQTSLRIQHFGSFTRHERDERARKYREADPENTFLSSYDFLSDHPRPSELRRWAPASIDAPVLEGHVHEDELAEFSDQPVSSPNRPDISVIIFSQHERTLGRTIESVLSQTCDASFETIVVVTGSEDTAARARRYEPRVRVIADPTPRMPGNARNLGLHAARGRFIVFVEAHVLLEPGNLAARLAAHRRGFGMVTGAVRNGTLTRAGWASYFLDHHLLLPGLPAAIFSGPPPRCSYDADLLTRVGGFPENVRTAEDIEVNREASRLGYVAWRDPDVVDVHESRNRRLPRLLRHHLRRGRGWARLMIEPYRENGRAFAGLQAHGWLTRHMRERRQSISACVAQADPSLRAPFQAARSYVQIGILCAWLGFWFDVLKPRRGWRSTLFGQPVVTWLIVDTTSDQAAWLLRADATTGTASVITLPAERMLPIDLDRFSTIGAAVASISSIRTDVAKREHLLDEIGRAVDLDVHELVILSTTITASVMKRPRGRRVGEILGSTHSPLATRDLRTCRIMRHCTAADLFPDSVEGRRDFAGWARDALGAPPLPADGRADDPAAWMA